MVHVGKGVYAGFAVIGHLAAYAVYYAGSTCGCGNFTGLEYIKRKGIVGLVAGTVGNGNAFLKTQFRCSPGAYPSLLCKGRADVGQNRLVKAKIIEEFFVYAALLEVLEHTL